MKYRAYKNLTQRVRPMRVCSMFPVRGDCMTHTPTHIPRAVAWRGACSHNLAPSSVVWTWLTLVTSVSIEQGRAKSTQGYSELPHDPSCCKLMNMQEGVCFLSFLLEVLSALDCLALCFFTTILGFWRNVFHGFHGYLVFHGYQCKAVCEDRCVTVLCLQTVRGYADWILMSWHSNNNIDNQSTSLLATLQRKFHTQNGW